MEQQRPFRPASHGGNRSERLSRFLALVLRHKPESIGLELDPSGFADVDALVKAVADQPGWDWVTEQEVRGLVQHDPRRYEIDGTRMRARYGHSIPVETPGRSVLPPEWLYHGTVGTALEAIRVGGLRPLGRQYVHLSATRQDAISVAKRHSDEVVLVTVLARRAHEAGFAFYQAAPSIYLVREVPPEFLSAGD
ncbi:MAG TPA: RNA 2'-phosphotransferase [bacterium]|nr:RNA 2'-phosphotransferase [bacterium]